VAHGRLRQLLGGALGLGPRTLEFTSGNGGKPALAGTAAGAGLRFNLSHSGGLGLVGWSWGRDIGVDVEVWRTMRDEAALVRRYFSDNEVAAWEALPADMRHEAFFNLWTRKEAYVKALGLGLGLALDSFDVSHESGAGARLLRTSPLTGDSRTWTLVAPAIQQAASIAVVVQAGTLTASPVR
jgi:4'-phosphopantetheinyl transferase